MSDEATHDWLNERELEDDRPSASELEEERGDETTVINNVGYVGDLRRGLKDVPGAWRIEIRSRMPSSEKPVIDEIAIADDGHVVIYIA